MGSIKLNHIYQMDCIEGLKLIPDKSIGLVVIDPPYNINKASWDNIENYIDWMGSIFKEIERVLKDKGSLYFFHNDFLQVVDIQNWLKENTEFNFKQMITWNKINPDFKNYGYVQQRLAINGMRNYYNGFTEYCFFYTLQKENVQTPFSKIIHAEMKKKGLREIDFRKLKTSKNGNPTGWCSNVMLGKNIPTKQDWHLICSLIGEYDYEHLLKTYENDRYPFNVANVKQDLRANSNVWLYPPARNQGHITAKPVELVENIIFHSSNEGDVVLDCFMGSGTTAVAALKNNRNFIGFETEPKYIEIANKRLEPSIMNRSQKAVRSVRV